MKKQNNVLLFENLSQFDSVIHGFSTRFFGDMRPSHHLYPQSIKKFTDALGVSQQRLVKMDQVHGSTVFLATDKDCGTTIPETDGLLTENPDIFLGVVTADCVPLLMYDPEKKYAAVVHAGWRGLFKEIIKEGVSRFVEKGSDPKDLIVGIGPCIRSCHYDIAEAHAHQFLEKFPGWKEFIIEREGKFFFDLPGVARYQLESADVSSDNIEDGDYCTFEHEDIYSCRKEGEGFGEMMGIIGRQGK